VADALRFSGLQFAVRTPRWFRVGAPERRGGVSLSVPGNHPFFSTADAKKRVLFGKARVESVGDLDD
jgi:hypothetical protein